MTPPLLEVKGLVVDVARRGGGWFRGPPKRVLDGVELMLGRGEILGLAGASGAGKTTLARALLGLIAPLSGEIRLEGQRLGATTRTRAQAERRRIQMVFQDPGGSLDPSQTVGAAMREALRVHGLVSAEALDGEVERLLVRVGLRPELAARRPHALSGGERQRVALARALAVRPDIVVADEPVSALDMSLRAQTLNLLLEARERLGLAVVLIAHDRDVLGRVADRVVALAGGRVVATDEERAR